MLATIQQSRWSLLSLLAGSCLSAPQSLKDLGLKLLSFDELRAMGKAKPAEAVPPSPDDYSTIM